MREARRFAPDGQLLTTDENWRAAARPAECLDSALVQNAVPDGEREPAGRSARVVRAWESVGVLGKQGQRLVPCVTRGVCGTEGISAGMVYMPPGARSKAHYHARSEIVVACVSGRAVTLAGPELTPHEHGPGDFLYVPENVVHIAVNPSATEPLVAVEMRTDPEFDDDVVLTPEYEDGLPDLLVWLRAACAGPDGADWDLAASPSSDGPAQ
jgi:uncharacterized RmlC-like cupin family protein